MTVSLEQIDRLRRMIAEPSQDTYDDATLEAYLARYPLPDATGELTLVDFNAAAADIWEEKAAAYAADFDFAADGGDYKRSQVQTNMLQMARSFRGRRKTSALVLVATPPPDAATGAYPWIGNLAEESD